MKTRFFDVSKAVGATMCLLCASAPAAWAQTADEFQFQTLSAIAAITGQAAEEPEADLGDDDDLRRLTDDIAQQVLAFGDQGPSQGQQRALRDSLERLVETASAQGLDGVYVNALVAEATGENLQELQQEAAPAPSVISVEAQVAQAVASAVQTDDSDPYVSALTQEGVTDSAAPAPREPVRAAAVAAPASARAPAIRPSPIPTPAVARATQRAAPAPEPRRQPAAAAASSSRSQERTHVVAPGETLGGIASKYYGSFNAYRRIYNANKDRIRNPNVIRVGVRLRIPR